MSILIQHNPTHFLCVPFSIDMYLSNLSRLAAVSIPLLSSLHRTDHTLLPFLLASMSTGQATVLIKIVTSPALSISFHHFIIDVYIQAQRQRSFGYQ